MRIFFRSCSLSPVIVVSSLLAALLTAALPAQTQTFAVIHSFTGAIDGANPYAGLTMDQGGNLYGTTSAGGVGNGTAFRASLKNSYWVVQTLYGFQGPSHSNDGSHPAARITLHNGIVYGTTQAGGLAGCANNNGCGTVFYLRPPLTVCRTSLCPWTETVLYRFAGHADGGNPVGDLVVDQSGNVLGATSGGGSSACSYQPGNACGVAYMLTAGGGESVLYQMPAGSGGTYPESGVTVDRSGNLFATTSQGGTANLGTIFELTPSQGGWAANNLYQFQSGAGGQTPWAGLASDGAGNFYGATTAGGASGAGTVYQLTPSGGGWTYSPVYSFSGSGSGPVSNLTIDSSGNLYGTTPGGGQFGHGSVFKLARANGSWSYTSLYDFTGGADGAQPSGSVILDASGNIYGTAVAGGSNSCSGGCGVIWMVSQSLTITTTSLPGGITGQPYQAQLAASGGQPPYTWAVTGGSLPNGLVLNTNGTISGTPTAQGTFPFTVQVTDHLSNSASKNLAITVSSGLIITTAQLPNATEGILYNTMLTAAGGSPPYTWSIVSGTLPSGLTLSPGGTIHGTPTASGLSNFTAQVKDALSNLAQAPLQISVASPVSNGTLSGHYAIVLSGFNGGSLYIMAGSITADGNGNIIAGKLDVNYGQGEPSDPTQCRGNRNCAIAEVIQSPGSTYDLSAGGGLGTMTIATRDHSGNPHTYQFSISVSGDGCSPNPVLSDCGRLIARDPSNPQMYGSGVLKVQDAQYFSIDAFFPGNFAFLAAGEDPNGKRYAAVGALATNPTTLVDIDCSGNGWHLQYCPLDANDNGTVVANPFRGTFSADLDPATGRGNFVNLGFPNDPNGYCTGGNTPTCGYAYYILNQQEMVLISIDAMSKPGFPAIWSFRRQPSVASWGNSALAGIAIAELTGARSTGSPDVTTGLFTADGNGHATFASDENNGGALTRQSSSGTYSFDSVGQKTGKATFSGFTQFGAGGAEVYVYNQNSGYVLGTDTGASFGVIEPQSGSPYSNLSVSGNMVGSTTWAASSGVTNSVTSLFADGGGTIAATQNTGGPGGIGGPNNLGLTYQVDSTGRAVVLQNGSQYGVLYVVGPNKFVLLPNGNAPALNVFFSGQPD
jgi:uncharacterized repeat protein (TIGR03803 family)